MMKSLTLLFGAFTLTSLLAGCSPEVGSEKWCENLKETPKDEWTIEEAKEYTKNCIF